MNIFKSLFRKSNKTNDEVSIDTDIHNANSSNSIPEDLFIDTSVPANESIDEDNSPQRLLNQFLEKDYLQQGQQDGFHYHSNEFSEIRKKTFRSEFRNLIDQVIEVHKQSVLDLEVSLIEVAELSKETANKIINRIHFINDQINFLNQQKKLSVENEGWIMSCINSYHQGFISGVSAYLDMSNLLKS